jgi:glycosyltransferase involved in cell wall biosynthesis
MAELLDQLRRYHLLLHPERFKSVRRGTVGGKGAVAFTVEGPTAGWRLEAEVWAEQGLQVRTERPAGVPEDAVRWLHDDLLAVAPALVGQIPKIKFLLVGDGEWRGRFEAQVAALGLQEHFVFTGLVPPEAVPSLVGIMDVLVHLSLREGLPRALPQALAAQCVD